jgi:hypothetical protein
MLRLEWANGPGALVPVQAGFLRMNSQNDSKCPFHVVIMRLEKKRIPQ